MNNYTAIGRHTSTGWSLMKYYVLVFTASVLLVSLTCEARADWWSFRGPGGTNVDAHSNVPTKFDDSQNVK